MVVLTRTEWGTMIGNFISNSRRPLRSELGLHKVVRQPRHVVKKVLSPRPPKHIIFGHMTGLFAMLSWSLLWVRDHFFATRFNLKKI